MRWINARPSNGARLALTLAPFALVLIAYAMGSAARLADNANDKLLPGFAGFAEAINRLAFVADPRTGDYILWADTLASLLRLSAGLGISTLIALIIGLLIGMLPYVRSLLAPFVAAVSMVPPLALLPILFIVMGLGENSKIALIVIGMCGRGSGINWVSSWIGCASWPGPSTSEQNDDSRHSRSSTRSTTGSTLSCSGTSQNRSS